MPWKDRLLKFQKRRKIDLFRSDFQYFLGLNFAAHIFTHTHTLLLPLSLSPSLLLSLSPSPSPLPHLPPPCVLLNEGFTQRWKMIRSYRIRQHPLEIIPCTTPNRPAPRVGNTGTGHSGSHSCSSTRSYKFTPALESISHRRSPMTQRNETMLREMTSSNSNAPRPAWLRVVQRFSLLDRWE